MAARPSRRRRRSSPNQDAGRGGRRLDRNLTRPGGRHGLWHLILPREEVKNGELQEYELPVETTQLLDRYLKQFRPSLDPGDSPFLIVVRGGKPKSQTTLSQQIREVIEEHVGVRMTPHQFRHFDAKLMLEHSPGAYAAAGHLLGHRNPKTTMNFYSGIDTMTAGRHFDRIIAEERTKAPPTTRRAAPPSRAPKPTRPPPHQPKSSKPVLQAPSQGVFDFGSS